MCLTTTPGKKNFEVFCQGMLTSLVLADQFFRYRKKDGSYSNPSWDKNKDKYVPSSNKAPQSYCPVLVGGNHVNPEPCERSLAAMRWGLIPSWFKGKFKQNLSVFRRRGALCHHAPSFDFAFQREILPSKSNTPDS